MYVVMESAISGNCRLPGHEMLMYCGTKMMVPACEARPDLDFQAQDRPASSK